MSQNRSERQQLLNNTPIVAEVLRRSTEQPVKKGDEDKDGIPVFWRIFGGTLLSIASVVLIGAYQNITGALAEIRSDLTHLENNTHKEVTRFTETQAELTPKEEFANRVNSIWRSLGDIKAERQQLAGIKERCNGLMAQFKAAESDRQQLSMDVQKVREAQAAGKERRQLAQELTALRERLAVLEKEAVKEAAPGETDKP